MSKKQNKTKDESILSKFKIYNPLTSIKEAVITGIILIIFVVAMYFLIKLF